MEERILSWLAMLVWATTQDLADALGVHRTTALRYLQNLESAGLVAFRRVGRDPYRMDLWILTAEGVYRMFPNWHFHQRDVPTTDTTHETPRSLTTTIRHTGTGKREPGNSWGNCSRSDIYTQSQSTSSRGLAANGTPMVRKRDCCPSGGFRGVGSLSLLANTRVA